MSIKDWIGGNKKGIQCERNPEDGSQTCTRFEVRDGQKISTGSTGTFSIDPATCNVVMSGNITSMMDDELEDFNKIKKSMESGCRKGIA